MDKNKINKINIVTGEFMKKIKIQFDLDDVVIITNRGSDYGVHSLHGSLSRVTLELCKAQSTLAMIRIQKEAEKTKEEKS